MSKDFAHSKGIATKCSEDAERDEVLRRMLKMPPKENKDLKTGGRKLKETSARAPKSRGRT